MRGWSTSWFQAWRWATLFLGYGILRYHGYFVLFYSKFYVDIVSVTQVDTAGKAVLITGCDSGFGFALAQHLDSLVSAIYALAV